VVRRAIVDTLDRNAVMTARFHPQALAATAIAGLFADFVCKIPTAPDIVALIDRQLAHVGLQLVPLAKN
jgi:hypothetical protein